MAAKLKAVIDVSGSVVQAVFTNANVDVMLVDWDAEGCRCTTLRHRISTFRQFSPPA